MTTRLKGKGRGNGRGRATAPVVAGQNLSDRPWCGPDVPHGFVDQRIEEGKSGVEITKAIGHHFEARPRTIKPGTEGIRVVRASTNDQVDPSANVRYKNLWLCNGFDDMRNSGAQPEYYDALKDGGFYDGRKKLLKAAWDEIQRAAALPLPAAALKIEEKDGVYIRAGTSVPDRAGQEVRAALREWYEETGRRGGGPRCRRTSARR